jgi:hypothetical protein
MNENSTNTELLIKYLDGELTGEELESVKKSIEEQALVRQEFENLRMAKEAIKSYGLQSRIRTIHSGMMQEIKESGGMKAITGNQSTAGAKSGVIRMISQYGLRVAAVLIVLFGISSAYRYYTVTPEKLFMEKFEVFDLRETRSAGSSMEELYKSGNMVALVRQYDTIHFPKPEDCFLAGNAFLVTHQPAKAIAAFTALQQINATGHTHFFDEDAEYFLALSYLANREPQKAIPLFEKIHEDQNNPYHQQVGTWFLTKVKKTASQ